jgi:replicative DNA helicase
MTTDHSPSFQVLSGGRAESSTPPAGRMTPVNRTSEEYLLGSVLVDSTLGSYSLARQIGIRPAAFFHAPHRTVWEAIEALAQAGEVPDLVRARAHLVEHGRLDDIGGDEGLMQFADKVPTTAQLRYFAEQVKFMWDVRHAITVGTRFVEDCYATEGREHFVAAAGKLGNSLISLGRRAIAAPLTDDITAVHAEVLARAAGQENRQGWIYTGLKIYDETYLPFGCQREDHFIVVAGGSSMGKSAFMRQIAGAALADNKRVLVFSRETSSAGFCEGLAGSAARVDLRHPARTPKDRIEQFTAECAALSELADKRLFCVQHTPATPMLSVEDLEDHVRAFANLRGMPDLVIIDYLQLFGTRKRCGSREQEVAHVSHTLQALQRSLGGVFVVGCQMNEAGLSEMRNPKRDADGKVIHRLPHAGDLRESQAIYHDADRVLCAYLPAEDSAGCMQNGPGVLSPEVWWVQIKRRRGGTGYVRTRFEKQFQVFTEIGGENHAESGKTIYVPPAKPSGPYTKTSARGGQR